MNLGIMLPNWIGDVVMATPTLRAIRRHLGHNGKIVGIMRPYVSEVLSGTDWFDHTILYQRKKTQDPELGYRALVRKLRAHRFDTFILMTNSLRTGAIAWLSGARQRIGYVRYGRGPLLNGKLYPPRDGWKLTPVSAVDYYLQLAYSIGCPTEVRRLELKTLPDDEAGARQVWDNLKLASAERVIAFNTGGARGAAKHWPIEYFIELAQRLVEDRRNSVLILCGPAEQETAAELERCVNDPRVRSMANQDMSLGVAKACIRRSHMMVTTDSGPRHFAAAFDVPVVSMFGPIDPRWSETYHSKAIHLQHQVPCGPCGRRTCPLEHHRCMRELTVDRVYDSVIQCLRAHSGAAA